VLSTLRYFEDEYTHLLQHDGNGRDTGAAAAAAAAAAGSEA
jgi:hypothetical protein